MARPGRPYWKGHLRLSLVSIPVEIYNAVDSGSDISFNQIHKPTGKRINYQKVVKGVGPIENSDIVKGYEIDKDHYVIIEPEELDAIKLESKKTVDLQEFVDLKEIDPRFFERPYYIVPMDDMAAEGYAVIREALAKMGKAGLGQVTMSGREYLVAVSAVGKGLVMEIMRYENELRSADSLFPRSAGRQAGPGDGEARDRTHLAQGGRVQARQICQHLCAGAQGARRKEGQGSEDCRGRGARADARQCHQSHGRASQERRGRQRRQDAKAAPAKPPAAKKPGASHDR